MGRDLLGLGREEGKGQRRESRADLSLSLLLSFLPRSFSRAQDEEACQIEVVEVEWEVEEEGIVEGVGEDLVEEEREDLRVGGVDRVEGGEEDLEDRRELFEGRNLIMFNELKWWGEVGERGVGMEREGARGEGRRETRRENDKEKERESEEALVDELKPSFVPS